MINFLYSAQLNFMPFITGYTASQEFPQFQNIQSELKVNYPTKLFFFFLKGCVLACFMTVLRENKSTEKNNKVVENKVLKKKKKKNQCSTMYLFQ